MEIQAQLVKGIKAAKHGDEATARDILYEVLDQEPGNETAWVWLSYVVDSIEDRQICLENVLVINPDNNYARQGLRQLRGLAKKQSLLSAPTKPRTGSTGRPLPLILVTAFWFGLGVLFLIFSVSDIISWSIDISTSRAFPRYITSYQLMTLAISMALFVGGVVSTNLAWVFFKGYKSGYFASILLSLGLTLAGPIAMLILDNPNYILAIFMALMPAIILFLTLMSQTGFADDRQPTPNLRRDQS